MVLVGAATAAVGGFLVGAVTLEAMRARGCLGGTITASVTVAISTVPVPIAAIVAIPVSVAMISAAVASRRSVSVLRRGRPGPGLRSTSAGTMVMTATPVITILVSSIKLTALCSIAAHFFTRRSVFTIGFLNHAHWNFLLGPIAIRPFSSLSVGV